MQRSRLLAYGFAVVAVGLAGAAGLESGPTIPRHATLLLFTIAVGLCTYAGGVGPGLLATALGGAIEAWLFAERHPWRWGGFEVPIDRADVGRIGLFLLGGGVVSLACHRLHITRRRAEAEARLLRQSEERFRLLMDVVRDAAVFMLDEQGRILSWNAAAQGLAGYSFDQVIGQPFARLYREGDVAQGWPRRHLARAAAEGRFEEEGWRRRRDGEMFPASVVITALFGEPRRLRGYVLVMRDLTVQRRMQQRAAAADRRARDSVRSDSRMKDELIAILEREMGDLSGPAMPQPAQAAR